MVQRATGTYHCGRIELDEPVDWEEGMRVSIMSDEDKLSMDESEWPTDAEGVARLVDDMKKLEPLKFTAEELAEIELARESARKASILALKKEWGI